MIITELIAAYCLHNFIQQNGYYRSSHNSQEVTKVIGVTCNYLQMEAIVS